MSGAIPKGTIYPKVEPEFEPVVPLNKKMLMVKDKGIEKKLPALHIGWAEKRTLMKYTLPPVEENGVYPPGAEEAWLGLLQFYIEDLKFLLSLPHHRFWSQVIYDPGVLACLDSYLVNTDRNSIDSVREFSAALEETVHRLVFLVFVRMATYKESKEDQITPAVFGDMIYENFLFDVCKIFDLCVLYGNTNQQLLSKMIGNIFTCQPSYYNDLAEAIPQITCAFDNIEDKLGVSENTMPVALSSSSRQTTIVDVHDIVMYLNDTLTSIEMFLTCHPPACKYFHEPSFEVRISSCYERTIPVMMEYLSEHTENPQLQLWIAKLRKRIDLARLSIIRIFRLLLQDKCFNSLETMCSPSMVSECVEKYVQVMSTCISDKTFIADYCMVYPVKDDLDLFKKHGGDITSLDFITDAVSTVMCEMGLVVDMNAVSLDNSNSGDQDIVDTSGMNGYAETRSMVPSDVELSSLVSHVQDLLPNLGEGFIHQCLQYYDYSTEAVINAILEDSLPPSLVTLDRSLPASKTPIPELPVEPSDTDERSAIISDVMDRANVYDNDEFDVFSRKDVDRSRIHKGKRSNKFLNFKQDEKDKEMLRSIARKYEETGGTSIYEDELRYEVDSYGTWNYDDDEYDDTYDDNESGNIDVLPEAVKKQPAIIGAGRLNNHIDLFTSKSDLSDEENSETAGVKPEEMKENADVKKSFTKPSSVRPKNIGSKRGVQRIFNKSSSKSSQSKQSTPTPEREEVERATEENKEEIEEKPRDYHQFCENPEEVRARADQRRRDIEARRYKGYGGRENHHQENGPSSEYNNFRPKTSTASNRNSGKSWRQGQSGDDDNRRYHGGKYKEDTNHGKAQSHSYRNKMMHKNDHKRQGAQAKFNRNNL